MTLITKFFVAMAAATILSCSSSKSPDATTAPPVVNPDDSVPVGLSANALKVVIPTHTVEPGDSFECYYTDITTDHDIYANSSTGKQGLGGHHIIVYST